MTSNQASQRALEGRIGVRFSDPKLLQRALIHGSVLNEDPDRTELESNERLEFLGDAVLGQVVATWLYDEMPDAPEGELTRARSALVSRATLSAVARSVDLGSALELGRGEEAGGGRDRDANLADTLEAVIAAIYLDHGETDATSFVKDLFGPWLGGAREARVTPDAKTRLQEIVQARHKELPRYRTIDERGPSHEKVFTVEVTVQGEVVGTGRGPNKRTAEQTAAGMAFSTISSGDPDD
jgi:ribonuclease-3